jgi:DNA polymerase III subunit gamma/tau
MSDYIVTARKWRPMKFEDVIGQRHVTQTLRNALASERLAHAYLFSGPRGVGKTTTARLLAKVVNCLGPRDQNPDNTCANCTEMNEGRSFDVQEIDGASNRGVDEIRNLREAVRYAPAKGRYKVYIIDEVHMLTKEAFNALLKTLEEPPPHVLFIFATTELHKVPATILSRCQRFDFRRIAVQEIADNLKIIAAEEGLQVDQESLLLIARRGDGSLRDAQSLFDQVIALCGRVVTHADILSALNMVDQEVYFRVTELIEQQDSAGALALVQDLMNHGYDLREFLGGLLEHFRNLMVVKITGSTDLIEASDVYRSRCLTSAAQFSVADLLRMQRFVTGTERGVRDAAQPRFRLEADMVQMVNMPRAVDLSGLIAGIEELKKKPLGEIESAPATLRAARPVFPTAPAPTNRVSPLATTSPTPTTIFPPPPGTTLPPPVAISPRQLSTASSPPRQQPNINEHEVRSRWTEYVAEVTRDKISVGAVLGATTFLGTTNGVVRIGCADEFQVASLLRNREILTELFERVFHVRTRIAPEIAGIEQNPNAGATPAPREEEHPILTLIKKEFGAEPV